MSTLSLQPPDDDYTTMAISAWGQSIVQRFKVCVLSLHHSGHNHTRGHSAHNYRRIVCELSMGIHHELMLVPSDSIRRSGNLDPSSHVCRLQIKLATTWTFTCISFVPIMVAHRRHTGPHTSTPQQPSLIPFHHS